MIETCLNLFGPLLTGLGAFVTARSVIISKDQAKMLSGTHWNGIEALRRALLAQSHNAQIGLVLHLCWHLIADRRSALFPDRCSDLPPF